MAIGWIFEHIRRGIREDTYGRLAIECEGTMPKGKTLLREKQCGHMVSLNSHYEVVRDHNIGGVGGKLRGIKDLMALTLRTIWNSKWQHTLNKLLDLMSFHS